MKLDELRPSHLPILKAVIEVAKPTNCLECGTGDHSTGLLSKIDDYTGIEHDPEWADRVRGSFGDIKIITVPLPGHIRYSHYPNAVDRESISKIKEIYSGLVRDCELLFIDSWACVRYIILKLFWGRFKIAVLHDTEERRYKYDKIIEKAITKGYVHVRCVPRSSKEPWTDIIIAPAERARGLAENIIKAVDCSKMRFKFKVYEK